MYIPEKLKLNRFKDVAIPSNRSYFQQFGSAIPADNSFTGDQVAPEPMNKVEQMEDLQRYAEMMQQEIINKSNEVDDNSNSE